MGAFPCVVKLRVRVLAGSPYASAVPVDCMVLDHMVHDHKMPDCMEAGRTVAGCKGQERVHSGYPELQKDNMKSAETSGRVHSEEGTWPLASLSRLGTP